MPPKQALVAPWPALYLIHSNRKENAFEFIEAKPSCRRHIAEVGEVLQDNASPAGFWRHEFGPPPGNKIGCFTA